MAKPLKEQLEVIFAKAILGWELGPHEPDAVYELNLLKDASFDLELEPADCLRVHIRKMRLSAKYSGRRIRVEIDNGASIEITKRGTIGISGTGGARGVSNPCPLKTTRSNHVVSFQSVLFRRFSNQASGSF